jgi:DNA polymerase-1
MSPSGLAETIVCHHGEVSRPLLIVDGDNLAHRAYHSTPKSVTGVDGTPINALVGVISMLVNQWQKEQPRAIFVAWDTLGVDTYRSKLWPTYQGGRIFEPSIVHQLGLLPSLCEAFGFGVGKEAGYEADDLMASAAKAEVDAGGTCLLLTADRDSYHLVSDHVVVLSPRRGARELDRIGPKEVVDRMGVLPEQVADFKALCGDPSDKIPGARGIGPKSAAALILRHGTLEAVLAGWARSEEAEQVRLFREVVQMRSEVAVSLPASGPNWSAGAAALRALGALHLADRVAGLG